MTNEHTMIVNSINITNSHQCNSAEAPERTKDVVTIEEASTHMSAKTHAGTTDKIDEFAELIVELTVILSGQKTIGFPRLIQSPPVFSTLSFFRFCVFNVPT